MAMRYYLFIEFKTTGLMDKPSILEQSFKTLKELGSYKSLMDDTVCNAWYRDNITGRVKWWVINGKIY